MKEEKIIVPANGYIMLFILLVLFFGSIGCVMLNKEIKNIHNSEYLNLFKKYSFYSSFFDFNFLRKQNLMLQSNYKPSIKLYKKRAKKLKANENNDGWKILTFLPDGKLYLVKIIKNKI